METAFSPADGTSSVLHGLCLYDSDSQSGVQGPPGGLRGTAGDLILDLFLPTAYSTVYNLQILSKWLLLGSSAWSGASGRDTLGRVALSQL